MVLAVSDSVNQRPLSCGPRCPSPSVAPDDVAESEHRSPGDPRCQPGTTPRKGPPASPGFRRPLSIATLCFLVSISAFAGERIHRVQSLRQAGETLVRAVTPSKMLGDRPLRALYVLPVEPGVESRWGDPWEVVRKLDLADRYHLLVVLPTFSALPWYANHPTDSSLRQEEYFIEEVVPLIERNYPVARGPQGRLLVGFSKSGWGAWSLLLRHLDLFGKAAAWDAPLMQAAPDRFGMAPIFGSAENFEQYRVSRLLREHAPELHDATRLVLTGYAGSFREHHVEVHELLQELGVPHVYRDGPQRDHRWGSGWLDEAVSLLLGD